MNHYLGEWRLALVVLNTLLLLIPRKVQNMLCAKAAVRQRDYCRQHNALQLLRRHRQD